MLRDFEVVGFLEAKLRSLRLPSSSFQSIHLILQCAEFRKQRSYGCCLLNCILFSCSWA